ncbi:Coenzyme F420 hydrogenase/dehydrogenase, beta subunit C-terminal domain [Oribacterium sp. WCC10]|uniref:Coenzyme F420 hydrogenase/dehydrogenase, beta subunit C-terminal domain n=1 Tax=Oribacterium sp. WCC10 TaxID=1855343 RepID=UPI0008EC9D4B|nr:Coenzyme F420 hydrogenase/dehydrogenase, beta subunit C-terminal domain [Oribacterium sp. WCC10]SFG64960.1 Coenzyme F420-reducing hydrogenase, beta subunit [Oribacterium sp. WCC10]
MITKAFACYSLNDEERSHSSSGGIYPLIAREVIHNGGVVYAACYDDNLDVCHRTIENEHEIVDSQGSKYVQSSLSTTFRSIISRLRNYESVLFVGTPCQCAGLVSLVNETKTPRTHLYVIDFVCHGVPGRVAWNGYKKSKSLEGNNIASINMRDKSTGWTYGNYAWKEIMDNGSTTVTPRRQNPYMKGMLANLYLRPSCYSCSFKGVNRCTDITLGDYWGVWDHLPEMDDNKGTSLVLVHTEQGMRLFEGITDSIKIADANIERAIKGNSCIAESTKYNEKREEFFERLNKGENFITIVDGLTKTSLISKVKKMMINSLNTRGGIS